MITFVYDFVSGAPLRLVIPSPFWAEDLPECIELNCCRAAFWPKTRHAREKAAHAAIKSEVSREVLRQKRAQDDKP